MLQTWKNIVLNWINCYFTESLVKEQNLSVESLHSIISHLRENLNLDESKSSTLEAFSIEEFLSEKYPEFKFEDGTIEPKNEDEYYLVASLLLFFVCTNSKDLDIKYAMCSKLKTQDQEVILKYSKSLMHVTQVKYKDVCTAILEACQEAVCCPPPRSVTSETPPSLRSLHSEVRRLQAALDAERFDSNFLQEELSRNNTRLEKLSKEKEQCKLEILNLKAKISLCCGQEKLPLSQSGDSNSTKFLKQVQDLEDRLVHTQEQLEETQYERDLCRTKINELKQERQKWQNLNQKLASQIDQLQEELDTEKRLSQSYKELVYELRIHNQRNFLDNSQLEWDDLEASIHSLPHNTSITSEDAAKPNLSSEMVTLKEELHSKLIIEIEQIKTQNYCYVSSLKKEIDLISNNFQKCKNDLHDKEETIDKLAFEITALKKELENNINEFDALGKQNAKLEHENKIIKDLFETEKNVSSRIIEEKRKQLEDILSELSQKNILLENVEKKNNELSEALNNEQKEKTSILKDKDDLGHENKVLIELLETVKNSASSTINEKQLQIDKLTLEIENMNKSILNFEEDQRELQLVIQKNLQDTALFKKRISELECQNSTLKNDAEIEKTSLQNVLREKENMIIELGGKIKSVIGERQALTDDIFILKQQKTVLEEKHRQFLETEKNMHITLEEKQKQNEEILSELSEKNGIIEHIKKGNNELSEALENELKEKIRVVKENEELSHENKMFKDSLETSKNSASFTINEKQSCIDKLILEINNMNTSILNMGEEKRDLQSILDKNLQDIAIFEKRISELEHLNKSLKDSAEIERTSLQNVLKEKESIIKEHDEKIQSLTGERQALTDDIVKHKEQVIVLEEKHQELLDTEKNMYRSLEEKQKHIDDILSELSEKNDKIEHVKKGNNELNEALENILKEKSSILKEKDELGQENKILKHALETVKTSASSTIDEKQSQIDKLALEKENNLQAIALYEKRVLDLEIQNNTIKDDAEVEKTSLLNVIKEKENIITEFIGKIESVTGERQALTNDIDILKQQITVLEEKHQQLLETEKNMCITVEEKRKRIEDITSELSVKNDVIEHVNKSNNELSEVVKNEQEEKARIIKDKKELEREHKILQDLLETSKKSANSTMAEKQSEIDNLVLEIGKMNKSILNLEEEKRELQSVVDKNLQDITLYEKRVLELERLNYTLKDDAEIEKKSLHNALIEKENIIKELIKKTESFTCEREALIDNIVIHRQQISVLEEKEKELFETKKNIAVYEQRVFELERQNNTLTKEAKIEKSLVQNILNEKEKLLEELVGKTESLTRERKTLNDDTKIHKQQVSVLEERHKALLETEKNMYRTIEEKQKHFEDIMSELREKNNIIEQVKKDNDELSDALKNELKEKTSISKEKVELIHENKILKDLLETAKDSASSTFNEKQLRFDQLLLEVENMTKLTLKLEEEKRELQSYIDNNLQDIASYEKRIFELECQNNTLNNDAKIVQSVLKEKENLIKELIVETEKNMYIIIDEKQKHIEDIMSQLSQKNDIIGQVKKDNNELSEVVKNVQEEKTRIIKDKKDLEREHKILQDLLETSKKSANSTMAEKQSEIDNLVLEIGTMNKSILNLEEEKRELQSVVKNNLQDIALYEKRVLQLERHNYTLKDDAEKETQSLHDVLKEKEKKIKEFTYKIESFNAERQELCDNIAMHKQQIKVFEEKQKHIEEIMSELSEKNDAIEHLKKVNSELSEGLKNAQKEKTSILKDKEKLDYENKKIQDLLETAKTSVSSTANEKQSQIDKLVLEIANMNKSILNLEEEKRELQSVVDKNLQDIALYEKRVLELERHNYTLKDDAELEKLSLQSVLKEKETLIEEFINKTELLTREREALNDDLIIHKQQTRVIEEKHRELLETDKNVLSKIIEEKQKHIESIMSELSQKNDIIEQMKKDNQELREVLKNEQKEKVSILNDKEEFIHESKIIKDLLEIAKNSACSTINEKQSQIDELVLQIVNMKKSKDNAEVESTSQQNVLTEKENKIKELIEKTESLTHERQALNGDIYVLKQHIIVLKDKEKELANRLQKLLLEHAQCEDTINNLKEQINLCNSQIVNFKVNDEVKRVTELLNNQREQLNDRDSIILKLITEKDAVIGAMSKELLEEKESKFKFQKELESKNVEVTELKLQISDLKKEEMMNYLRRENDELIKAAGQKETLMIVSQEKSGSKSNQSEKQQRMYFQVDNSAPFDNTQSSLESYKTISDLEKIIQDKNRTITTLQSDLTYMKSLMAESENKLLDVNKELEIQKETCDQLSSQLKKIINQKNDEIADLKKQLNKMCVTENRASEIVKLSAKYQAIILKRIAEIKTNTVLKELQNFGNSASSDHELRRGIHAGNITMDDLENFLETTEKHLKRFSEKQIVLQKERDRLYEVARINESEIINLKKFLTELSLSFKSFSSVKEVYSQKLSKVVSIQRTVRREILNSEGHVTDGAMCKLERGYAAVMQDLAETVMNVERWVERCLSRTISPEKIKQAFTSEVDRVSLSSSSYQNTGLEVQLEELEKSFQKLLDEVSQARRGEGSKDTQSVTVMEVRAEYEDKLNRMKSKMKQLFEEQIIKFKEKQKKEIADLNNELEKAKENLAESSKAYEEHIRALTTELWSVGEKFLIQKDEVEWLKKQHRSGSLLSLQPYHTSGLGVPVEEANRPSDTASLRSLPVIRRNPDSKPNKKREGRGLHMSDEEGEVFDNRCLKELTSTPRAPSNSGQRLSELQWRNSLCPPHLKSSYPAETQFSQSVLEDDIKHSLGPSSTLPGRNQRKEVGITAYKKPGPPTPSKQAGRLSATDSELRESLRVEMNPHASRKTGTPSRLRALFRSTRNDTSDMTPRRRLSNIFRKK